MAIDWTVRQASRVGGILVANGVNSGNCLPAAREIHPVALERDAGSVVWQLWPTEGRYVVPRTELTRLWHYHATVEVSAHCVCALTGVPGTARAEYVARHWKEDGLAWELDEGSEVP
ncbi:MAG: hypothetical protein KIT31_28230 [Deltaproteobacteria bacterium]|nr:hypothetical protein [Deltaproteobacteria bacterium]